MPPDAPHKLESRLVTKSRVIAGILSEIDAAGALVLLAGEHSGQTHPCQLRCEFRVPFETSELFIRENSIPPGSYRALAMFAGQRLEFTLQVKDASGQCYFPAAIAVADLRGRRRRHFGPEVRFAEIATASGVVMATPIDLCQDAIALRLRSAEGSLVDGERVHLRIRGDTRSSDIYSASMVVTRSYAASDGPRVLLAPVTQADRARPRRASRLPAATATLAMGPLDAALGAPVVMRLLDASLTGCRCQLQAGEQELAWAIPGLGVRLGGQTLRATIMWRRGDQLAVHIDGLDHPPTLQSWAATLRDFRLLHGYDHSQVDEIVRLFTETGLLKGKRRRLYGDTPVGFLPSAVATANPLLYQRVMTLDGSGRATGHISIARKTENLWYFQEGAHNGLGGESYRVLYQRVIQTCRTYHGSSRAGPRYLSGLYHANIKSAGEFGVELFADPSSRVFPMLQFSLQQPRAAAAAAAAADGSSRVLSLVDLDADGRRRLLHAFDATLVEAFVGVDGQHPRLNAELASLGPNHHASTVALADGAGVWGLAYRLNTYYAFNATGVMNSIFVIAKPTTNAPQLLGGLAALAACGMTNGTDDAAVIVDGPVEGPVAFLEHIKDSKPFTYFIIDNHLNREFLGATSEPDQPSALRKDSDE